MADAPLIPLTPEERRKLIEAPFPEVRVVARAKGWGGIGNPALREHVGYEEVQGGFRRLPIRSNK